jgi:hypothetical protein
MFGPIPNNVLEKAEKMGNLPALMDAVDKATSNKVEIRDWTPFVKEPRIFSRGKSQ